MDQIHGGTDWGGFAFWLFIAACVLAGTWEKIRRNAEKHETLRIIIEKTGTVDEAKLKELFNSSASGDGSTPGESYRGLRIAGVIVMGVAAGMAVLFLVVGRFGEMSHRAYVGSLAISLAIAFLGMALFFSSRYAQRPPDRGDGPTGR